MDEQLRERVARAIHAQCRATPWPESDLPLDAAERQHCYACADVAIGVIDDWWIGDGFVFEPPAIVDVKPVGGVL